MHENGPTPAQPTGHPPVLWFVFWGEFAERCCYYGMRAMLVPYMLYYLQFQPAASSSTYKWYTSLVYLTPLIGGFLADKFLGLRMSILIGGVLMAMAGGTTTVCGVDSSPSASRTFRVWVPTGSATRGLRAT